MKKIAIIIPAYNEEKRIGETLGKYLDFFKEAKILVVINGTTDNTLEIVKKYPVQYLNFEKGGKGFAIKEGFKYALENNFDLIGYIDADMATPPESFSKLIEGIENYDGIISNRWMKESIITNRTFKRKILSFGFNFLVRLLFHLPQTDTQCGSKLFKKEAIRAVIDNLKVERWEFDVDLLYNLNKQNFKIKEIPTIWDDKKGSKISLKAPIQMFTGILRLRLLYSPFKFIVRAYNKIPDKFKVYKW